MFCVYLEPQTSNDLLGLIKKPSWLNKQNANCSAVQEVKSNNQPLTIIGAKRIDSSRSPKERKRQKHQTEQQDACIKCHAPIEWLVEQIIISKNI